MAFTPISEDEANKGTSGFTPISEDELFGEEKPKDTGPVTPSGMEATGTTPIAVKQQAPKTAPGLISAIAEELEVVDPLQNVGEDTEGNPVGVSESVLNLVDNLFKDASVVFSYPLKKFAQGSAAIEQGLTLNFKPGEFERLSQRNKDGIGKALGAIGYASAVIGDYYNQDGKSIFEVAVDDWMKGRTVGQSLEEGILKVAGANPSETQKLIAGAVGRSVDLNDSILMFKANEMYNKYTANTAKLAEGIKSQEVKALAGQKAIEDAIENTTKAKKFEMSKVVDETQNIDYVRDMINKPEENLLGMDDVINVAKKDVYTGDSALDIKPGMREEFVRTLNAMKRPPADEIDLSLWDKIKSQGTKVAQWGEKVKKDIHMARQEHRVLTGMAKRFSQLANGTEMGDLLSSHQLVVDRHLAPWIKEIGGEHMKAIWTKKRLANLQKVIQGKEKPIDKYNQKIADVIRRGYDQMFDEAANKYKFQIERADGNTEPLADHKMANYDYRILNWELSKIGGEFRDINIEKIMVKKSIPRQAATDLLDSMREKADGDYGSASRNGSLHFAREFDLEGYDNNPIRSYIKYAQKTAKEFAMIDQFGEGMAKKFELLNKISDTNKGITRDFLYKMFDRATGKPSPGDLQLMKLTGVVKGYYALKMLYAAGIGNIQQFAQQARYDSLGAFKDVFTNLKNSKEFVRDSGAITQSVVNRLMAVGTPFEGGTVMGSFFKYNGFQVTQAATEAFGALGARRTALRMFETLKKNQLTLEEQKIYSQHIMSNKRIFNETPEDAIILGRAVAKLKRSILADRQLREFKIDPDLALKEGKLSYDDLLDAGQRGAKFTSDKAIQAEMPMWTQHPMGQLGFMYKSWAKAHTTNMINLYKNSKLAWDQSSTKFAYVNGRRVGLNGNPRAFAPLLKLAVSNGVTTTVADALRRLITTGSLEKQDEDKVLWWLEYTGNMTFGGLFTAYLTAAQYGERGLSNLVAGPIPGDLYKGATAAFQSATTGEPGPAVREAISDLPLPTVITKPLKEEIAPKE